MQEWLWELISEPSAHQKSIKMSFIAYIGLLHSSFLWSDSVHKWRRHCLGCQEKENLWYNFSKWQKSMQWSSLPEQCCICLLHYIKVHLFYIDQYFQAIMWGWGGKYSLHKLAWTSEKIFVPMLFMKAHLMHCDRWWWKAARQKSLTCFPPHFLSSFMASNLDASFLRHFFCPKHRI